MALNKKYLSKKDGKEGKKTGLSRNTNAEELQSDKAMQVEMKAATTRESLIKSFHPAVAGALKESLGLDIEQFDMESLYDILQGKFTKPIPLILTPLAYDVDKKEMVSMPKIQSINSLAFKFPYVLVKGEDGKSVPQMAAPDKDHPIAVRSVACRPYLEAVSEPSEEQAPAPSVEAETAASKDSVKFSKEEEMALEGIGISRERLVFGNYNKISSAMKQAIRSGEEFPVYGSVRTPLGSIDVAGYGRLEGGKAMFQPNEWEKREEGLVIDLMEARHIGNMDIDIYSRDSTGNIRKDINGNPKLNFGAETLVKYGVALEPMTAYVHTIKKDEKTGKYSPTIEKRTVQVSVLNGSLVATPMKAVLKEGVWKGEKDAVEHYEAASVRLDKNGRVYIDGERGKVFDFKSKEDRENYVRGIGGVVRDVPVKNFATGKVMMYDLFVVPSNQRGGFGHKFSPSSTEKILEDLKRHQAVSQKKTVRRKQNYQLGL